MCFPVSFKFAANFVTLFAYISSFIEVDTYGTVQPHTLIRQHLDYTHWYDRQKLTLKDIHNCQYVSCMNPTAGSFTINPRLQVSSTQLCCCFNLLSLSKYDDLHFPVNPAINFLKYELFVFRFYI